MCSFKFCGRSGKHAWTYSPRPASLAHIGDILTYKYVLHWFLSVWLQVKHRQRKELGSVQLSEHPLKAHLGPQHPACLLRCPWGPSGSNSCHCLDESSRDLFAYFWISYRWIYIQHMLSAYSGSFTQYHVCSLYSESVGQCPCIVSVCVFVSPVVVFHCLTESQFIYPFSLSTSSSFPIFF